METHPSRPTMDLSLSITRTMSAMAGSRPSKSPSGRKVSQSSVAPDIIEGALQIGPTKTITASDVYTYVQSPFALWCNYFAPKEARDPEDEFQRLLKDRGRDHEKQTVANRYPKARQLKYKTEEEGFELVVQALREGASAIHGGPLFFLPEGYQGRFDILERVDAGRSVFGDFHYVVKEIKLARNIRDPHRLQAAFYNLLIGKIQGYTPPKFTLVNGDGTEIPFAYDEPEILSVIESIRQVLTGKQPPAIYGHGSWPWESYTDHVAEERHDVSLIPEVGPYKREKLVAAGVSTVQQVAEAPPSLLTSIKGIGEKTATKFINSARAIQTGKHIRLAQITLPKAETELYVDLEGTGGVPSGDDLEPIDYLIGVMKGAVEFRKRWAGWWVLKTNTELPAEEVARRYLELARVEEGHRVLKETLKVRPLRHRLERRVGGHLLLCHLALVIEKYVDRQVKAAGLKDAEGQPLTGVSAIEQFRKVKAGEVELPGTGQVRIMISDLKPQQRAILTAVEVDAERFQRGWSRLL